MSDRRGEMRATPRNALMGYVADALSGANNYAQRKDPRMPGGLANPVAGLLSNALSVPALATTADRMSYGEPLTNARQANVPWLKPETADALMMAPLSPRNALAAASMGLGMADNGAMKAATVWHGTPHKFDKFDASKIGTGEGAQAYGHGLYLAQNKKIAEGYRTTLSDGKIFVDGDMYEPPTGSISPRDVAMRAYLDSNGDVSEAMKTLARNDDKAVWSVHKDPGDAWDVFTEASDWLGGMAGSIRKNTGSLYKVDLPDDQIAKMLDWDKPLSQQAPGVQAAFAKLGIDGGMTGQQAYRAAHESAIRSGKAAPAAEKERQATEALRRAGIPGIRYLDGGSRSAGQGSSNFVVFPGNESMLSILERNGQPIKAPNQRGAK